MSGLKDVSKSTPLPGTERYVKVRKLLPNAQDLEKAAPNELEWSLTLVKRTDNRTEDNAFEANEFQTGLEIYPPNGTVLLVLPDKHLYRQGYSLLGPMYIKPSDRGEVIVPLLKFRESEDLELPFTALRVIAMPIQNLFQYKLTTTTPKSHTTPMPRIYQPEAEYYPQQYETNVSQQNANHFY